MAVHIDSAGVSHLLDLLQRTDKAEGLSDAEIEACLNANSFFVDYYCQWDGVTRSGICQMIREAGHPDRLELNTVLSRLRSGFVDALKQANALKEKLFNLNRIDSMDLANSVAAHLPPGTPLDSTIYLTIDGFNGAFQYKKGMGFSLLLNLTQNAYFKSIVAHELHHVGFNYWAELDSIRKAIIAEQNGRSIAVQHIQNLLSEGLAVYYCTPEQFSLQGWGLLPKDLFERYTKKIEGFRSNELQLFRSSNRLLHQSLEANPDLIACRKASDVIAIDIEGIQPSGHYIGYRMVEVMARHFAKDRIVDCVRTLPSFLITYNEAARKAGCFQYDQELVSKLSSLWKS